MEEPERYNRRMRNRLHIMNIESNNMEVYLYTMVQQHGLDYVVPLPDILQLYEEHAPSMDAPGEYRAMSRCCISNLPMAPGASSDRGQRGVRRERAPCCVSNGIVRISQ